MASIVRGHRAAGLNAEKSSIALTGNVTTRTKAGIQTGQFRPSVRDCCILAGCSIYMGSGLFKTIEVLHLEAADDPATRDAIVERVAGDERAALAVETLNRIVRAVVMGAG